jgi:hypothetical protein
VIIRIQEKLSQERSHVVAYVTGQHNLQELRSEAVKIGEEYNIPTPRFLFIDLNAAARSSETKTLVVITADNC